MTKRFIMPEDGEGYGEDVVLVDNATEKQYTSNFSEVVDLLNRLNHEVEYWKGQALSPLNQTRVLTEKIHTLQKDMQNMEDNQTQLVFNLLDKYLKQRDKAEKDSEEYTRLLSKIEAVIDIIEEIDATEILTDLYTIENYGVK